MSISIQDPNYVNQLIETKLYKPTLPVDMVRRPHLTNWLKKLQGSRPLTLVSAPAGYGKSTLISCWLEQVNCPTAWLSLDEQDNELHRFLQYFLAAIQTIFPNKLQDTGSLLACIPQPPVNIITTSLVNEIDQIGEFFILVLDDYEQIVDQTIHDLLNELLLHPPQNLHLVISTRIDPPLSLVTLRGKGLVTEVRVPGLRFNQDESLILFKKLTGSSIDQTIFLEIDAKMEGWVTGLRLAALAMYDRLGGEALENKSTPNNTYVSEYLITEILGKQAAMLSDCMLKSSIPSRICADLCEELCLPGTSAEDGKSAGVDFTGEQFLEWLRASNLFITPLGDSNEWHRYHHLFREFLQQELVRRFGHEEIKRLHAVAGRWYARNGWIDDAFYHLLPSGDISAAIELVAQHRYRMMNETQWPRLDNLLKLFQDEIIESSLELLMLKTWLAYHSGRWAVIPSMLNQLDAMLANEPTPKMYERLAGEIHSLRSLLAYHANDAKGAVSHARVALKLVPPELWIVRILARLYLGGGLLMLGDSKGSLQVFYRAFEEEKAESARFKATLLTTIGNVYWLLADLHSMQQVAGESIELALEANSQQILGVGQSHLGCALYQQNDLPAAEKLFAEIIARPYQNYGTAYINSVCGLAMTYQAQGRELEARQITEGAIAFLLNSGNATQLSLMLALQTELALKQGNLPMASQWAERLDPVPPLTPLYSFLAPHLTLVKVWLAQNTPASQGKAGELLEQLQEYLTGTHNTRFMIDTLVLQALLAQNLGNHESADAALIQALRLAQAGDFIRVFVDAGPGVAGLLARAKLDNGMFDYVGRIRMACSESKKERRVLPANKLLEPLTDRELQILELLKQRLSNKEIAGILVISPGTVKGHTIKIYQKLNVKNRRQAVEKAFGLGLLSTL